MEVVQRGGTVVRRAIRDLDLLLPAVVHLLAVGAILLLLARLRGAGALWDTIHDAWDARIYMELAADGYPRAEGAIPPALAFPPLYPMLLAALGGHAATGFAVTVLLGAVASGVVGKLLGRSAGIFFAVMPTWLWFTSVLYTEALFVALAAVALVSVQRERYWSAGYFAALASLTRYLGGVGFLAVLAVLLWQLREDPAKRRRAAVGMAVPLGVAGVGVMAWHFHLTGDPFAFFEAQDQWGASLRHPWAQIDWILHGWFTNQQVVLDSLPPLNWLLRNLFFEAAALGGTAILWQRGRRAEAAYCGAIVLVTISTVGMPAISVPRLLLGAFPAFAVIGAAIPPRHLVWVVVAGTAAGAWIGSLAMNGFFA